MASRLQIPPDSLELYMDAVREIAASEAACEACPGPEDCPAPRRHMHSIAICSFALAASVELAWQYCEPGKALVSAREEAVRLTGILRSSGLGTGTEHMTLETFRAAPPSAEYPAGTEKALRLAWIVAGWAADPDRVTGLLFMGPHGVGKTHLSVGIMRKWLAAGRGCLFEDAPALFGDLWPHRNGLLLPETLAQIGKVPAFFLDDLGGEKKGALWSRDWEIEQLFKALNRREHEDGVLLVASTNCRTAEQLRDRIGERNLSRLLGMCDLCPMDGEDHRPRRGSRP